MFYPNSNGVYEMLIYHFNEECYWAPMEVRKQLEELALSFTMWALGVELRWLELFTNGITVWAIMFGDFKTYSF